MKTISLFIILFLLSQASLIAQRVYRNGNLQTGTVSYSGITAPAGYKWSECQNDNAFGSNTLLGSANQNLYYTLVDDFRVPVGQTWNISKFSFYAYQTGSPSTPSPFNQLYVIIYNGPPNAGGSIIYNGVSANLLSGSFDTKLYRIAHSTIPSPGIAPVTTRLIWRNTADIAINLTAGTYWVEWTTGATNFGTVFCPPSTVAGQRDSWSPPVANALQKTQATSTWGTVFDIGNPLSEPDVNVEFPFEIEYTTACPSTFTVNNFITFNDIKAQTSISTAFNISNIIPASANVVFQAGNSVLLNPGFKTSNKTIFTAKILGSCL